MGDRCLDHHVKAAIGAADAIGGHHERVVAQRHFGGGEGGERLLPEEAQDRAVAHRLIQHHADHASALEEANHVGQTLAPAREKRRADARDGGDVMVVEIGVVHRAVEPADAVAAGDKAAADGVVIAQMPGDEQDGAARAMRLFQGGNPCALKGFARHAGHEFRAGIEFGQRAPDAARHVADKARDFGLRQVGADEGEVFADAGGPACQGGDDARHQRGGKAAAGVEGQAEDKPERGADQAIRDPCADAA